MHGGAHIDFHDRQPLVQHGVGAVTWTSGVRLPPGRWVQFISTGVAGVRFVYAGTLTTPPVVTFAAAGVSVVCVHPGPNVYVQVQAGAAVDVWMIVTD